MNKIFFNLLVAFIFCFKAEAQVHYKYTDLLKSLTQDNRNVVTEIPDLNLFYSAKTIQDISAIGKKQNYARMISLQKHLPQFIETSVIKKLIQKKVMTIVIVPGLLTEFVTLGSFDDIFKRDSSSKREWTDLLRKTKTTDSVYNLENLAIEKTPLSNVIQVASIDDSDGQPLIKLVELRTPFGSLETLGNIHDKASVFARRLQKYVDLTHDENLVLLGYSRGTPLALEMITQAKIYGYGFLKNVSSLVSYSGVVMGSSLADLTDDPKSQTGLVYAAAKKLLSDLQTSDSVIDLPLRYAQNSAAVTAFLVKIAFNADIDSKLLLRSALTNDFSSTAALIKAATDQLGYGSLFDFNGHVNRTKKFISELITAVDELKTSHRAKWWQTHTVPKNIKYLSIAAAMADPLKSDIEKEIYNANVGYNNSTDDALLQVLRRDFEKSSGYALNDSQVGLHQSLFLPALIETLNPQNAGLNIETLGLLQTHHWAVVVRNVNAMHDGRMNPFPRESVLMSLAAYLNQ
jgi:pimeloyl-ACP methyl ester carboxylesterase